MHVLGVLARPRYKVGTGGGEPESRAGDAVVCGAFLGGELVYPPANCLFRYADAFRDGQDLAGDRIGGPERAAVGGFDGGADVVGLVWWVGECLGGWWGYRPLGFARARLAQRVTV